MDSEEYPEFHKTFNGHMMEIFPTTGQDGVVEEVVFWCRTCDPNGFQIKTKYLPGYQSHVNAYKDLLVLAEIHAKRAPSPQL